MRIELDKLMDLLYTEQTQKEERDTLNKIVGICTKRIKEINYGDNERSFYDRAFDEFNVDVYNYLLNFIVRNNIDTSYFNLSIRKDRKGSKTILVEHEHNSPQVIHDIHCSLFKEMWPRHFLPYIGLPATAHSLTEEDYNNFITKTKNDFSYPECLIPETINLIKSLGTKRRN